MVTERLAGADGVGSELAIKIAFTIAAMRIQIPYGALVGIPFGQLLRLAAAEFHRIGIALPARGLTGGGFARRPQVHDLV